MKQVEGKEGRKGLTVFLTAGWLTNTLATTEHTQKEKCHQHHAGSNST